MDGHDLLERLRGTGDLESVGDAPEHERPVHRRNVPDLSECISHVIAGNRRMPVLKAMTTTACERDCLYCPFRAGRSAMRRVKITPDDLAHGFMALYRAGAVEGLFLSSGVVRGGVTSQDAILDVGAILREKYHFGGYIHLKIMPGAERDQVMRAMTLANRVSANLEAPTADRLARIAPGKQFAAELLDPLRWVHELRQSSEGRLRASSTTEFVVGPAGEPDVELLSVTEHLHHQLGLARVYFSAFRPVADTPLDHVAPTNDTRRIRLYQASFLIRDYGFGLEEMPFTQGGNLPLNVDPKRAWADEHLREAPLEVNTATRQALMRVPGIGAKGAERIVAARRKGRLRSLSDLRGAGVANVERAASYLLLDGRRPVEQPRLF